MSINRYDVLVVGAGLFGSTVARMAADANLRVLIIEKRDHVGGNCWSFRMEDIDVHAYGPHVLHTNNRRVWDWFCSLTPFSPCLMQPIARYKREIYNLPFNMNTFYALWGTSTPDEAREEIERQRVPCACPRNLEEYVLDRVGRDVYEKLVKGYTEKQYGKPCRELPASLIRRMPLVFNYDNDYSRVRYQGVPVRGWAALFEALLEGIEVRTGVDYLTERDALRSLATTVVFTGPIDAFYDYRFGPLEYRGRRFEHRTLCTDNYQGCSLVNYTDLETPQLRTIEHRHFSQNCTASRTVVTTEYATAWEPGDEPYYTINDKINQRRYARYHELSRAEDRTFFGGRLGEYRYYDMQDTVQSAWRLCAQLGIRVG